MGKLGRGSIVYQISGETKHPSKFKVNLVSSFNLEEFDSIYFCFYFQFVPQVFVMPKFSSVRRSKRKFQGNQHTKCKKRKTHVGSSMTTNPVEPMEHKSVSFEEVGPTNTVEDETTNQLSITGYRLVDISLRAGSPRAE